MRREEEGEEEGKEGIKLGIVNENEKLNAA